MKYNFVAPLKMYDVKRLDFNKTLKVARYGVMKSEAPDQSRTRKLKDNSCTSMTELIISRPISKNTPYNALKRQQLRTQYVWISFINKKNKCTKILRNTKSEYLSL